MIVIDSIPFIRRRKHAVPVMSPPPPPPAALTLVSVTENARTSIDLTFDRAIDIAGLDVSAFVIEDGDAEQQYTGTGTATLIAPAVVRVGIAPSGDSEEPGVHLTASAENGIVAVDDGGTWEGVADLAVPWP